MDDGYTLRVIWAVLTVAEFNGSCLVADFGRAPADAGVIVVGTAQVLETGMEYVQVSNCPLWRSPESFIEEEASPQLDAQLDELVGPLHSKTVHHG